MRINGRIIEVYVASKLKHATKWKRLRKAWEKDNIWIVSRWIEQAAQEDTAGSFDFKVFWSVDQEDVSRSDVVLVYGESGEDLRGALVEAGMGIAYGKMLIVVGNCNSFGTWTHHPNVYYAETIEKAKELIVNRFCSAL